MLTPMTRQLYTVQFLFLLITDYDLSVT